MVEQARMHLEVLLPTERLIDEPVSKIIAEAENGEFCLLPRHIDFVAGLVPGILTFVDDNKNDRFVALDEGVLVKCGSDVSVSALNGVTGSDLGSMKALIEQRFQILDEQERKMRSALLRLEVGAVRGFRELRASFRG